MKINRIRWMKKIFKLIKKLLSFQTAIACEDKIPHERLVVMIGVFQDELSGWLEELVDAEWMDD